MGGIRFYYPHQLFHKQPKFEIKPDFSEKDTMGKKEGGGSLCGSGFRKGGVIYVEIPTNLTTFFQSKRPSKSDTVMGKIGHYRDRI